MPTSEESNSGVRHIFKTPINTYSENAFDGWALEKIALRKFSWLGKK
jgi:hypothetical protein